MASSSAGFLSSMIPSGRPLTNSTTSGRRVFRFSVTVNWLTARKSLLARLSKSMTRTWAPRMAPMLRQLTGRSVLHRHTVHQHPVEGAVAGFKGRAFGAGQLAEGILQRRGGQGGVQFGEGVPQPPLQNHLPVVVTLGIRRIGGDVRPVRRLPAEAWPATRGPPVQRRIR